MMTNTTHDSTLVEAYLASDGWNHITGTGNSALYERRSSGEQMTLREILQDETVSRRLEAFVTGATSDTKCWRVLTPHSNGGVTGEDAEILCYRRLGWEYRNAKH